METFIKIDMENSFRFVLQLTTEVSLVLFRQRDLNIGLHSRKRSFQEIQ